VFVSNHDRLSFLTLHMNLLSCISFSCCGNNYDVSKKKSTYTSDDLLLSDTPYVLNDILLQMSTKPYESRCL